MKNMIKKQNKTSNKQNKTSNDNDNFVLNWINYLQNLINIDPMKNSSVITQSYTQMYK